MTDRVFEDARSFEVSGGGRLVDVYVFDAGDVSWRLNPDRMGGQFTQEEINRRGDEWS